MIKNKRTIIESLIKDIKKGLKRIFWFTFTITKYFFITIKFKFINKKTNLYKISILLPSRERSKKFDRMLKSLIETCLDISRLEILLLLDSDDNQLNEYKKIVFEKYKSLKIAILIKDLKTNAIRNNYLASISKGDVLFPINDDLVFISKNWDKSIDIEFSKINMKKPYCLWIDSGKKYAYLHCDFPILNRSWYERLGYIGSEFFNFWYMDTWICDLCFKSKKFIVTKKIKVNQLSADTLQNEVDNTFLRNKKDGIPEKDFKIWNETKNNRFLDSKKLL